MDLSRRDYASTLNSLSPNSAVTILNDRVKSIGKLNQDIADWLQERRKIEEAYAVGLKKLARRQLPDDNSELGIFSMPWQRIINSTETIATSHQTLAQRIESDVERPLKDFASKNRDMQSITTTKGNFAAMAKEVDSAQDKADKLKKKGAKAAASKVANATSDVEQSQLQWTSQAPFVFENLQTLDEARLNHLRDVLTQFQTHEVDQVERNRVAAEECLNTLLNVETTDEIKTFAAKMGMGRPSPTRTRSRTLPGTSDSLAPPTPVRNVDDAASQRSGASGDAGRAAQNQEPKPEKARGLKRLGTVIGRRKSYVPGRGVSPEKPSRFGRSSRDVPPLPQPRSSAPNLSSSPPAHERLGSSSADIPPTPTRDRAGSRDGGNFALSSSPPLATRTTINGVNGTDVNGEGGASAIAAPTQTRKDSEGFTMPPPPNDAISQAEQEAAEEQSQPQFKLDIRNAPIQEEDRDAATAMTNVANALRAQAAPSRKTGTIRGRRDVRNTIFVPSSQSPEPIQGETPSLPPNKPSRTNTLASEDHGPSDSQSIRSSRSLSSLANTAVRHPEMQQPGLNASLAETVTVEFTQGHITKAVMIGEMALIHNAPDVSAPARTENIRLDNFHVLEKVAPNPAFITPLPDRAGEYTLNLSGVGRTAVAFKYQIHLDQSSMATTAPLILSPTWKIESNQASVILSYSLNPAFPTANLASLTFHNVSLIIHLEGAKASTCQSKPVGTFSKERSLIYWHFAELTITRDAQPEKLLARFATTTEARPGPAEARWEISGDQARELGSGLGIRHAAESAPGESPALGGKETDPFADEGTAQRSAGLAWKPVPCIKKLTSGKYTAV
ncbi:MAG: hypothetical protein M1833_002670 [Piccolia ochrophora]|nr:MAG: hypothetical protein M1833_002670 [Piccolia ochrophora]